LWSHHRNKTGKTNLSTINKYGWPDKKYNYFSWALSALQFRKYYDNVELVTDKAGYDLLINRLELPYTSVKVILDDLDSYHKELMVLGKIYAYSIQQEPFIHVDADAYIWGRFDDALTGSQLICQSPEDGAFYNKHYGDIVYPMLRHFDYYPEFLESSIVRNNRIRAINAGIIGGSDNSFFSEYAKIAFEFIDRNTDHLHKVDVDYANIVFEQFVFSALAESKEREINFLSKGKDTHQFLSSIVDFSGVPGRIQYIHLYAGHKKGKYFVDALEYRLMKDHPNHYNKIIDLLKTNRI
jgi:hypothetical protein